MLSNTFLAWKHKNRLNLIKAFNWFAADLQILVTSRLKSNLSYIWTPNNFTEGEASTLCPISKVSFAWSCFFLSIIIYWHLTGLKIIFFVSNQSMALLVLDPKTDIKVRTFSAKVVNLLSSAKVWTLAFLIK